MNNPVFLRTMRDLIPSLAVVAMIFWGGDQAKMQSLPQSSAVVLAEFIYETAPYPQCHASTIAELSPGKLVAAWFGGTRERAPDVRIWVARWEQGKWTEGIEAANSPARARLARSAQVR